MKARKKIGTKAPSTVRGIKLAKVNEEVLDAHLAQQGVKLVAGAAVQLKVEHYADWVQARIDDDPSDRDFGTCENCEAVIDPTATPTQCPVCGITHEDPKALVDVDKALALPELDKSVAHIRGLLKSAMTSYWQLGRALADCHDRKLYKARVDDKGKPLYKSWEQFAEAELDMSGNRARVVMRVAKEFSENDVVDVGIEKLRIVSQVIESQRPKALELARKMNQRELVGEIKKKFSVGAARKPGSGSNSAAANEARAKATQAATEAKAKRREAAEAGAVTTVFQLGEVELPLRQVSEKEYITTEELVNGVRIEYKIMLGKTKKLKIKRVRAS